MLNTKSLENIIQLKPFWGMINYYRRQLPNSAGVLDSLHNLLRKNVKWRWDRREIVLKS